MKVPTIQVRVKNELHDVVGMHLEGKNPYVLVYIDEATHYPIYFREIDGMTVTGDNDEKE